MADNTVALGIKVPDAMASLGSVMGAANAMQAYKAGSVDLERKRATLESDIDKAKAESNTAQSGAQKAEQEMRERQSIAKMMQSGMDDKGDSILNGEKEPDPARIIQALGRIAPLIGHDYAQKIMGTYTARVGLHGAATALDAQQRGILMGPIQAIATNPGDPAMVDIAAKTIGEWAAAHPEMKQTAANANTLLDHIRTAKTPEMRAHMANSLAATLQGGQAVQTQPQATNINTGGETLTGTIAPPVAGGGFARNGAVQNTPAPAVMDRPGGMATYTPPTSTGPGGITPVPGQTPAIAPPMTFGGQSLQYPKREAGAPYTPGPSEPMDAKMGQDYRNSLVGQQQQMPTIKRNNEELTSQIDKVMGTEYLTSGIIGGALRNLKNWAGDPTYKQLSKDLANAQISAIKSSGGSLETDAGKSLVAHANGDETYPPEVLRNIARRASADITNADMQATAAQKFSQQYGDNNMKAFQLEWNKNADSRVFEAMNLYNRATDKAKVKPQIDALFGNDPAKRKEYFQKYQNLQKMYQTGSL